MASETFYKPIRMKCADDGATRTVRVKCYRYDGSFAADTYFSVPANTRVRGRYVHGYVTGRDDESGEMEFRAHTACKGAFTTA